MTEPARTAPSARRAAVLGQVAHELAARSAGHALRVGVDGVCGAGRSTFARELVECLTGLGRDAVHLDSDGFHHPRSVRHRQGRDSPRGYYEDAYDFAALTRHALIPLGPGGSGRYATAVHDMPTDERVEDRWAEASEETIVIFACTLLQRGRLRELWGEVIYLDAARELASARGVERDAVPLGGREVARAAFATRYMAACDIYLGEEHPRERAGILIDHDDPAAPRIRRLGRASSGICASGGAGR